MSKRENKVVVKLDQVTPMYGKLVTDCRTCFEPGVSRKLKEERKCKIKDYVILAKQFSSSHVFAFSQSEEYNNLKIISLGEEGKTYFFKVNKYMLSSCLNNGKEVPINKRINGYFFLSLQIEENDPIIELVNELKQNSSSSYMSTRALAIKKIEKNKYLFLHYSIEKEEKPGHSSLVKLILKEIGPRIELQLQKIEEGICTGRALYHSYIEKTKEEIEKREIRFQERRERKQKRIQEQEENLRRKKEKKESESEKNKENEDTNMSNSSNKDIETETDTSEEKENIMEYNS